MKFFIPSFIIGLILSFFILETSYGMQIFPIFTEKTDKLETIKDAKSLKKYFPKSKDLIFSAKFNQKYFLLNQWGKLKTKIEKKDFLISFSKNNKYFSTYKKVGKAIEFYSSTNQKFWRKKSLKYPYLSNNGRLILLLNGDQSEVAFADYNGNDIGDKRIRGRICTSISFSCENDFAGVGFFDGTYAFINSQGKIFFRGREKTFTIKGTAISSNGLFATVHYGNTDLDYLKIIDFKNKKSSTYNLKENFTTKTSIQIRNNGSTLFLNKNKITCYSPDEKIIFSKKIPEKKDGQSNISYANGLYAVSYISIKSNTLLFILDKQGKLIFSKRFSSDSFIYAEFKENFLFVKGSDNLYCYTLRK